MMVYIVSLGVSCGQDRLNHEDHVELVYYKGRCRKFCWVGLARVLEMISFCVFYSVRFGQDLRKIGSGLVRVRGKSVFSMKVVVFGYRFRFMRWFVYVFSMKVVVFNHMKSNSST